MFIFLTLHKLQSLPMSGSLIFFKCFHQLGTMLLLYCLIATVLLNLTLLLFKNTLLHHFVNI